MLVWGGVFGIGGVLGVWFVRGGWAFLVMGLGMILGKEKPGMGVLKRC